jgi:Protein of unknown function (DUF4197)
MMKKNICLLSSVLLLVSNALLAAGGLATVSKQDQGSGLKAALKQAAEVAVDQLGKTDGFFGNPELRIPLPGKLEKARKTLRKIGLNKQADDLALALNRAAEAAVPEARALLVDSIKQMSVQDALGILTGPQDAATQYFRKTTNDQLTERFMPIVSKATQKAQLAHYYDQVASKATMLGVVDERDANLDGYVTRKALDGLFATMAKEEAAIRSNPAGQASSLLQKVFGAIGK